MHVIDCCQMFWKMKLISTLNNAAFILNSYLLSILKKKYFFKESYVKRMNYPKEISNERFN